MEDKLSSENFILNPDFRFLSNQIIDTRPFLAAEEQAHKEELNKLLNSEGRPAKGNDSAQTTITVFSDFECPYCRALSTTLNNEIVSRHAHDVKIVFRHFPLPYHPWAREAAIESSCRFLEDGSSFWPIHDTLFRNQPAINPSNLDKVIMQALQTEPGVADSPAPCAKKEAARKLVDEDIQLAGKLGVEATPTMFINGLRLEGAPPAPQIEALINRK